MENAEMDHDGDPRPSNGTATLESASLVPATTQTQTPESPVSPATSVRSLKRGAEMIEEDQDRQDSKRKRLSTEMETKEEEPIASTSQTTVHDGTDANRLVEEMDMELTCGCCAAICYNPVIVLPCQHYYCGSCYTLWTRNSGVNCPSCRSPVTSIIPSRAIQSLVEAFLRCVPSRARLQREKEQADEIYTAGQSIAVPTPRPRSPEISPLQHNEDYYRPCPHCATSNDFNWSCPEPIIDPSVDINRARLLSNGIPPGHAKCGSCDHLHATRAPSTSRCDFCHQSFCGLVVPTRCHAKRIREQKPIGLDNLMDILGNTDVYDAFGINAVEFDFMLDYLREHDINPGFIYSEIAEPLVSSDNGWRPLLDRGLFPEITTRNEASSLPPVTETVDPPVVEQEQAAESPASPTTVIESAAPETAPVTIQPENVVAEEPNQVVSVTETLEPERLSTMPEEPEMPPQEASVSNPIPDNEMPIDPPTATEPVERSPDQPVTPLVVPERIPTPTLSPRPEPTLEELPAEVEATDNSEPPTNTNTTEPIATPNEDNSSDSDGSQSQDNEEEQPSSPAPADTSSSNRLRLNKICRNCALRVFFWGARNWWITERAKAVITGDLPEEVRKRKDCESLGTCEQELDNSHAREFNHIPQPLHPVSVPARSTPSDSTEGSPDSSAVPPPTDQTTSQNNTTDNQEEGNPERPSEAATPNNQDTTTQEPAVPMDTDPIPPSSSVPESGNQPEQDTIIATLPTESAAESSNASNEPTTSSQPPTTTTLLPANGGEYSEKTDVLLPTNDTLHTTRPEESRQALTDVA